MYSVKAESSGNFPCILQVYIPNSIKVVLAIGHWQLGFGHFSGHKNTVQCFA